MTNHKIDISHKTVFFIAGFLALLWALFLIRDVIVLLFIAIILMSALAPIVEKLVTWKLPRALAIALTYIVFLLMLVEIISLGVTPLIDETNNLIRSLPENIDSLIPSNIPIDKSVLQQELSVQTKNALGVIFALFSNFIAFVSVLVLTFYLLLERSKLDALIAHFFVGHEDRVKRVIRQIEEKLGSWMRGQLALSLIIGIMVYILLSVLGVPYALPLSILAGILEVVPMIGPIISSVPSILIAYLTSPFLGLITAISFFVIQQLENHLIVPQVMKKAVGLNPLIVILAVAIGGRLLGVSGALLAVPITVVVQLITEGVLKEEV